MRYTKYEYWISTKSLTGRRKFLEVVCGSSVGKVTQLPWGTLERGIVHTTYRHKIGS